LQGSDFIHQIEADCPSLGRSYEGIMQLDEHVRASTERWKSKHAFQADADQVLETWEQCLKGNGQVMPILQAAHVAAYLLDPAYATVDKNCVSLPEIPAEHEQMPRDLVKHVGRAAAVKEFEQLLLGGYADEQRGPAAVCTDSSATDPSGHPTASVGSKRAPTAATPIGSRKGFWRRYGKRRYPNLAKVPLCLPAANSTSASTEHNWTLLGPVHMCASTALGLERTKNLIMSCFNNRCRVAGQKDFHLLLETVENLLADESNQAAVENVAGLHEAAVEAGGAAAAVATLLWPEGEMRRHRQSLQSKRVTPMVSGACTVSVLCFVYTDVTHAYSCAFIFCHTLQLHSCAETALWG
jgi:hypothetical protein